MTLKTWEDVSKYQKEVSRIMINSQRLNRISHAYIFEGPNGTKKNTTALLLAKTLLCTNKQGHNPCNECHNCRRVDHLTHPNLFLIKPEGKVIKKDQIQKLIKEFSKASLEKGPRIYIVNEADKLNTYSANTLLKTMEEPGADIYQVLITENYNHLLKTIISRAENLHFTPIDRDIIKQQLLDNGIVANIANAVSQYTVDMQRALEISNNFEMINIMNLVLDIHKAFLNDHNSSVILFKNNNNEILKSGELLDFFLDLMIYYQKDVLNYQLRHLDSIVFEDEIETIKQLSEKMSQKYLEASLEKMLGLKNRLKFNINTKLAMDQLLMCLERGYKYATFCSSDSI